MTRPIRPRKGRVFMLRTCAADMTSPERGHVKPPRLVMSAGDAATQRQSRRLGRMLLELGRSEEANHG